MSKVKGSQEAHEAIRPALVGASKGKEGGDGKGAAKTAADEEAEEAGTAAAAAAAASGKFLHPSELPADGLEDQQRALYELVYRRTLASAMAESEADFTTVKLGTEGGAGVALGGGEVCPLFVLLLLSFVSVRCCSCCGR